MENLKLHTYNDHVLFYLPEFVKLYGSMDSVAAYRFENFYQTIKKWVKRGLNYYKCILIFKPKNFSFIFQLCFFDRCRKYPKFSLIFKLKNVSHVFQLWFFHRC